MSSGRLFSYRRFMNSERLQPRSTDVLTGKVALVTGAASGIGLATATQLCQDGAHVYAVDIDRESLTELAQNGPGIEPIAWDLADLDTLSALPTDVDILVNNAGVQHISPVVDFPLDRFEFIMRLMLHSPYYLTRQCLPHMYQRGWGRVVNISSVHGLRASAFKSAYVIAKHGLQGMSKSVALEGAEHGVTSNCINPAYVRTPLVEGQIADQARTHRISADEVVTDVMLAPAAVKRLIEPDEVGALVSFLCSPFSSSITGASLTMDGGWTAH